MGARSIPASWPTAQGQLQVVVGDDAAGLEPIIVALHEDDVDIDGSPSPLRVYDQALREEVAEAMRRFTNPDAPCWIGPEVVIGLVEKHLLAQMLPALQAAGADPGDGLSPRVAAQ